MVRVFFSDNDNKFAFYKDHYQHAEEKLEKSNNKDEASIFE